MATPVEAEDSSAVPARTPGPLSAQLVEVADVWASSQQRLVTLAAEFADSHEWVAARSPTAAHWLAGVADVAVSTAREWVRIGRRLRGLPGIAEAFAEHRVSYSKVRTLTRVATPTNEAELLDIALAVPAGQLGQALAAWVHRNSDPAELEAHHQRQRSVRWRTEPDGMVFFTMRLPPLIAGMLIAWMTAWVASQRVRCTERGDDASGDAAARYPSLAQQHADAMEALVADAEGEGTDTEVVLHVRGDGCALDDGTPIADSVVAEIAPRALLRALIHDAESRPVNASGRQRHPTARQRRVVKERDRVCVDCGSRELLQYDHVPAFQASGRTVVNELELRCAPCHRRRHGR